MFDELVSSKVTRRVTPGRGLAVGMLHGIIIAGAIRGTARPPSVPSDPPIEVVIFQPVDRPPVKTSPVSDPTAPPVPVDGPVLPAPPVDVPPSIPPVTPAPPIDATTMRHILSTGVPGTVSVDGDSLGAFGVLAAAEVDEPAVVVHQAAPRYPPVLQRAGLEGRVVLEFIIDTTGQVEETSVRVLESSNAAFNAAAGETLRRSVFRPARVHGGAVRQRTVQSFTFRIAQ